ncbi:MAG TPA: TorF family putative porin [Steroidobacteraceae bacterium]|nr:TorF family putative porin [Steroidobacteraceae bacterium]
MQRSFRGPFLTACALLFAAAVAPAAALPAVGFDTARFNIDLSVSSDYVVHGITRSQGKPVAQAQLGWTGESGFMVGAWLSTLDLNPGPGPEYEIDPYLAKRWTLSPDWSLRTDLTRYMFRPSGGVVHYDYTELRAAMAFRDVLDFAVSWAPDYSGFSWEGPARNRTMVTYEASAHVPATRRVGLNAGVGRRDLEDAFGRAYWYWSAGTEANFDRVSVAVTWIGTSYGATELYGHEYAGNRLVATVGVRLH